MSRLSRLSPNFVRVTLAAPELEHFSDRGLDQRIKVVLPLADSGFDTFPTNDDESDDWGWWQAWRELPAERQNPIRTYTARSIRRHEGEIDVDFVTHGDGGPASAWVGRARVGDELVVVGPDARSGQPPMGIEWNPGDAATVLLAGDETAVPAIAAILETLAQDARGCVFLEVPTRADILPLIVPDAVDVHWLPRDAPSAGPLPYGDALVAAVRDWTGRYVTAQHHGHPVDASTLADIDVDHEILWEVPDGSAAGADLYAFFAGEASAIKTLRRFLVSEVGLDRQQVAFMGYWRQGKAEN
ncbi:siderophore-interacting protein [Frondihabitans australicus]|uniref:siderophore-interacting protein n=1 Tax=Frondihabitans australicus TaxID=386892 RepID=UPI001FE6CD32|nr:siderophore-interacting protein [Frondihabitans australicus]